MSHVIYQDWTVSATGLHIADLVQWEGRYRALRNMYTVAQGKHLIFKDGTSCTVDGLKAVKVRRPVPLAKVAGAARRSFDAMRRSPLQP